MPLAEDAPSLEQSTPSAQPSAAERLKAFVLRHGFGAEVWRAIFERPEPNSHGLSRRGFLKGTAATLTGLAASGVALAEEDHAPEITAEDVEIVVAEFAENPEHYIDDPVWIHTFLSLNFFDAVGSLARDADFLRDSKGAVGKSSLANLLLVGLGKISGIFTEGARGHLHPASRYSPSQDQVAGFLKDYDHEFPHTNMMIAVGFNGLLMSHSPKARAAALHGIEESILGVGLLLALTSVGKGIRVREDKYFEAIRKRDEEQADVELGPEFKANIEALEQAMVEIIGAAPFAAALTQVPLTAFGNARVAREKLLNMNGLSQRLFAELMKLDPANYKTNIGRVENTVLRKIMLKHLPAEGQRLSELEVQAMSDEYMGNIGVGMLSGMMDVTQAAIGDAGPSIVGAIQSYGLTNMLKTASGNLAYTLVIGAEESAFLAKRMGVAPNRILNGKTFQEAGRYMVRSWTNLAAYARGAQGSPEGARFGVFGQLGDDLGSILRGGIQSVTHIFGVANEVIKEMQRGLEDEDREWNLAEQIVDRVLTRGAAHGLKGIKSERDALLAAMAQENESTEAGELLHRVNRVMLGLEEAGEGTDEASVEQVFNEILDAAGQENPDEKELQTVLQHKLHKFHELFAEAKVANTEAVNALQERLHALEHVLEKEPSMWDLFRFEYWELHLGAEMAETAFVVFLQGIHIVGLTPTVSRLTYQQSELFGGAWDASLGKVATLAGSNFEAGRKEDAALLGSMMVHGALSSVADNWADELIHAKQLPKELFFPGMIEEFGLNADGIEINENTKVTEQYLQFTIQAEAQLKAQGREAELPRLYDRIYDRFLINKFMSILAAVMGGGESMIGNSPHFSAIVGELKKIITLGGSFADILKNFPQHGSRLGITFLYARLLGPQIERMAFKNPFTPENRGDYTMPDPNEGAHH